LAGYNDLATANPDLAAEALFDPTTVTEFTNKKLPWRCVQGHKWTASVANRANGNLCPFCSNQKVLPGYNDLATTHPQLASEALFDPTTVTAGSSKNLEWRCVKGHEWEASGSNRVRAVGGGCPVCGNKTLLKGYNDLATTHPQLASEALFDATEVVAGNNKKFRWRCGKGHEWAAAINSRSSGKDCPYCAGSLLLGFNDLATVRPDLASEALFDPTTVTLNSAKKVRWQCQLGHEWDSNVANRTRLNSGCPYCAGQSVLAGFNDLATVRPDLAAEALFDATTVVQFSKKKLPWRCPEGHEWITTVAGRSSGRGCPSCAKTGYDSNEQGWIYLLIHPEWKTTQIGITNQPKVRLREHASHGWEFLDLRGPMDGDLARQWETDILRFVKSLGINLRPMGEGGKFSGYTEAWWTEDFQVKKLKVLMDKIDALETNG